MSQTITIDRADSVVPTGKRKVDVSRGSLRTDLAMECWKRPDDERFLSMEALIHHLGVLSPRRSSISYSG